MLLQLSVISFFLLWGLNLQALILGEKELVDYLLKSSPQILQSEVSAQTGDLALQKMEDLLGWSMAIQTQNQKSNELGLSNFEPITKSLQAFETMVRKKTTFGLDVAVGTFTSQYTNNFIQDSTKFGLKLNIVFDLYQDIFGKKTKRELARIHFGQKISHLKKAILKNKIINDTRKLYWSLVFNNESLKILHSLLEQSQKQANDARKRFVNSATDSTEVSRYDSLVSTRKTLIYQLEHQKEEIIKMIRVIIPDLKDRELQLGNYNLKQKTIQFYHCIAKIQSFSDPPLEHTQYDELVNLLKDDLHNNLLSHRAYDDIDIKLTGQWEHIGKSFEYAESFKNYQKEPRSTYYLGLNLSIPLGKSKKRTADLLEEIDQKRHRAQTSETLSKIHSVHLQTLKNINLLHKIEMSQKENLAHTEKILQESRKKYSQARIMARDLITEESFKLQVRLDHIKTKQLAMNMLLDYFSVFSEIPCMIRSHY